MHLGGSKDALLQNVVVTPTAYRLDHEGQEHIPGVAISELRSGLELRRAPAEKR
jgi:hypothetical protein